ncbi:MAG: hypothetical protein J7L57_07005 [Deltaproteobacteria bacterium]|nr:hypothetical protein [Candidatus Tharpella sp.]
MKQKFINLEFLLAGLIVLLRAVCRLRSILSTCISRRAVTLEQKNGRLFAVRLYAFVRCGVLAVTDGRNCMNFGGMKMLYFLQKEDMKNFS